MVIATVERLKGREKALRQEVDKKQKLLNTEKDK